MWRAGLLLACICSWIPISANGDTDQADASALGDLYRSLNSAPQLTGWTQNGGDPCGGSWKGITCSGSSVTEIKLSSLGLSGTMSYSLGNMKSLTYLDLSSNNIGSQIQYALPPNLVHLDLSGNTLDGNLPYSISQLSSLEYLNVNHNKLGGGLNDMFWKLPKLSTVDLSFNTFSGNLPLSFGNLTSLNSLFLQNNQFTGTINVLADLPLENLNIANNKFTGWIPGQLQGINIQSDGNTWNSGPAPPSPPGRKANPGQRSGNSSGGGGGKSGISGGGVAGIIISLLVVGCIVAFFFIRKKRRNSSNTGKFEDQSFAPLAKTEINDMKAAQSVSDTSRISVHPPAPINLRNPILDKHKSYDECDVSNKPIVKKTTTLPINATAYSVADLQMATGSFSLDNLVGEGSIGRVFRAQFDDGKILAVKKINSSALSNKESGDFLDMVSNISRLHHPNVTELVGYCCEHGQHLLVYEFLRNGSLHDFLHLSDEYSKPLTWKTRVKIALGTARALEYLHEVCSPSIVHKNFKSANILLDAELNPHLSDCGLSIFLSNTEQQAMDTTSGYRAPEVAMSGQFTYKSDVYSFGVVMLELLTGRKPYDSTRPRFEQSLVQWAAPQLHDIDALDKMVDPALKGLYPAKSLSRFADVIALCVQSEPEFRPPMSEVVQSLVRLVQRANMSKRMGGAEDEHETSRRVDDADIHDMF